MYLGGFHDKTYRDNHSLIIVYYNPQRTIYQHLSFEGFSEGGSSSYLWTRHLFQVYKYKFRLQSGLHSIQFHDNRHLIPYLSMSQPTAPAYRKRLF